jgi:hypothetical protein
MTTGFTIEVWIKPSQQLSSQRFVVGQAYGRQLVLQPGSGGLVNAVMYLTTTNGTFVGTTPVSIPVGQYTHVAATYDAAFLKLYTNGVLARTSAYSGGLGDSFCAWGFGGLTSACGFSGQYLPSGSEIDEVSLYNRALLAGEINASTSLVPPASARPPSPAPPAPSISLPPGPAKATPPTWSIPTPAHCKMESASTRASSPGKRVNP